MRVKEIVESFLDCELKEVQVESDPIDVTDREMQKWFKGERKTIPGYKEYEPGPTITMRITFERPIPKQPGEPTVESINCEQLVETCYKQVMECLRKAFPAKPKLYVVLSTKQLLALRYWFASDPIRSLSITGKACSANIETIFGAEIKESFYASGPFVY